MSEQEINPQAVAGLYAATEDMLTATKSALEALKETHIESKKTMARMEQAIREIPKAVRESVNDELAAVAESVARAVTASTEARISGPVDKVEAVVRRADTRIEKADQASRAIFRLPLAVAGIVLLLAIVASYLAWRVTQSAAELHEQRKEKAALAEEMMWAQFLKTASVTSWCNERECVFDVPTASIGPAPTKGRSRIVFKATSAGR